MKDPCVSLDLEMTSARAESQEVVEIAAVKFRGERVLSTWARLIRPRTPLPYNVQVLTGIRPADLARAPALEAVADELVAFVGRLPLVGHSVSADVGCLRRQGVTLSNPQLDTFELASVLLPRADAADGYSLAALARRFGIPFPSQHRAAADALVTRDLFLALARLARELEESVLQEINRLIAPFDWPLKAVFQEAEREAAARQARAGTLGASIRQQLRAKAAADDLPLEVLLLAPLSPAPLRPQPGAPPLDAARLADLLGADGPLARSLPGYAPRPAQLELATAIARTLGAGGRLLAEAGPGTGRSLAYLLPAAAHALASGEPVVVAASTPARLEQLAEQELPALQRALPALRTALARERESYLCLRRWSALRHRRDLALAEALTLAKTLVWLPTTSSGDGAELNLSDAERETWRRLAADDSCDPASCHYARRGACFLERARAAAASAHVVLASHALVLADAEADAHPDAHAGAHRLLPDYRRLIVDEAHHLEAAATAELGGAVTARDLLAYLDDLGGPGQPAASAATGPSGLVGDLAGWVAAGAPATERAGVEAAASALAASTAGARAAAAELGAAIAALVREASAGSRGREQRLRLTRGVRGRPAWPSVAGAWQRLADHLAGAQRELDRLADLPAGATGPRRAAAEELALRLCSLSRTGERLRAGGDEVVGRGDPARVEWLAVEGGGELVGGQIGAPGRGSPPSGGPFGIHWAPLHVGEALERELFGPRTAVVLTSSTLVAAGSFGYVRGRLGLAAADELVAESPYDVAGSTLLYLPSDVPEPEQPAWQEQLQRALLELCTATRGRALVLFTTHSQLRQTWQGIHEKLAARGILVLGQGVDGSPRRQLLQTFRSNPQSVLLATGGLWEQVDVPGEALSVLVITRLPFAPPGDPVVAGRSDGLRDPLNEYSLPETILRFRQGFQRLIRSPGDRGVAVVFDRRVQSKSYGQAFLRSLPACAVQVGPVGELPEAARRWLAPE